MTRVKLTYADYAALPDDGRRYELHEGELSVTPAPGTRHQLVIGNLYALLREHVRGRELGQVLLSPTDCIMSDITVVQPDIVYVATVHGERISERAIEGAPTLAIEVISPSSERIDRRRKLELYARHGVPFYWVVDPAARVIEAYVLAGEAFRLAARLAGHEPGALPPFDNLALDPTAVWA
jgi:Uma2 family endonuclease